MTPLEIQKKLQTLLTPHRVILGGSQLRGESTPYSDVDFFVIPKNFRSLFSILKKKQSIQKYAQLHVCFPRWAQKHFYYVYGKDIHENTVKITPPPSVVAYNCATMCSVLLMEAYIALVDNNADEAHHICQKIKKNFFLLTLVLEPTSKKNTRSAHPSFDFDQEDIFSLDTLSKYYTQEIDALFTKIDFKKIEEISTHIQDLLRLYFLQKKPPILLQCFSYLDLIRKGDFHFPEYYFNRKRIEKIHTHIQNKENIEIQNSLILAQKKLIHWITI